MLRLKSDFVETFCQVYLEKHKPYKYQKLLQVHCAGRNTNNQPAGGGVENQDDQKHVFDHSPGGSLESIPGTAFVQEALTKQSGGATTH